MLLGCAGVVADAICLQKFDQCTPSQPRNRRFSIVHLIHIQGQVSRSPASVTVNQMLWHLRGGLSLNVSCVYVRVVSVVSRASMSVCVQRLRSLIQINTFIYSRFKSETERGPERSCIINKQGSYLALELRNTSTAKTLMMMMNWCLMSSDVMRHIRDKLWPMPKHGAINLYVHGNQKAR